MSTSAVSLAIAETHPVQYHAPVYRHLAGPLNTSVVAVYGSDFSISSYRDKEFGATFAWDQDLLAGVDNRFVGQVAKGGPGNYDEVTPAGLNTALAAINPEAVLVLGYSHPYDKAAINWAKQNGKPILFRGETSDKARQRSFLKRLLRDVVLRRLYRQCAAFLYLGHHSKAHYERLGVPAEKLFFSPYCVDATTFRTTPHDHSELRHATRKQLGIADDAIVIAYSGKLSERKGVDLLPSAVRMLPPSLRSRLQLLLIGDGALRGQLEANCQDEPTVNASFTGFQNQSALSPFYHAADVFVLPSRSMETWGLVVNEALLHGLPCVVSESVGCQPNLVIPGKTGFVCKNDDVDSLAQSLAEAVALAHKPDTSAICQEHVAAYSVSAAAEGIQQALRFALNAAR